MPPRKLARIEPTDDIPEDGAVAARLGHPPADHFKRAALDYSRLSKDGEYDKSFPSLHLAYDISSNLKARASWSTRRSTACGSGSSRTSVSSPTRLGSSASRAVLGSERHG